MGRTWKTVAAAVLAALAVRATAAEHAEERLARNLAALLVAGRAVVAQNQALINDAAKGDKGFTPEKFGAAVAAEYKAKAGIDVEKLDASKPDQKRLKALFDAEKQVVAEAQATINLQSMGFKGFTPAVFGRQAAEKFAAATGLVLKQTSEKYRNPQNQPDAFERKILAKLASPGWEKGKGYAEVVSAGGKKQLRYLQPLYIASACLACHGDPKGELDVAGRAKEGYREGELRGAVSVTVPVSP
jgi:general secretion pathway protein A